MNIGKSRKTSDLAALDGATFGLDKAMTLHDNELLPLAVVPVLSLGDPRSGDVYGHLSAVFCMN